MPSRPLVALALVVLIGGWLAFSGGYTPDWPGEAAPVTLDANYAVPTRPPRLRALRHHRIRAQADGAHWTAYLYEPQRGLRVPVVRPWGPGRADVGHFIAPQPGRYELRVRSWPPLTESVYDAEPSFCKVRCSSAPAV